MKITVVRAKCCAHRNCAALAPNVFDIDEQFKAVVLDPKGDSDAEIRKAAEACPVKAIILEDEQTGKRIYP